MKMIKSMWIALAAYSVIPVPRFDWTEENMRFSLCFLPVVGLIEGAIMLLWGLLCKYIGVGNVLFAAAATIIPLLLTGGIHMDGYCDCVDALSSHRDRAKMLEILKDPHVGAFAVIYCIVYLLASFGLYAEIGSADILWTICIGFVLSRALTAISAVWISSAGKSGFLVSFAKPAHKKAVIISMSALAVIALGAMVFKAPIAGGISGGLALISFFGYRVMALKKFGGVTGDTSGFFLQICELMILIGTCAGGLIVKFI